MMHWEGMELWRATEDLKSSSLDKSSRQSKFQEAPNVARLGQG